MKEGENLNLKNSTMFIPKEAYGVTQEMEQEIEQFGKGGKTETWDHFTPEYVDTHTPNVDVNKLMQEIGIARRNYKEGRLTQAEGTIKFDTNLPISIFFVGDVHLGSIYTDHERFMNEMEEIRRHPNAYVVFMSNLIDNAIPTQFPDSMLANAIHPQEQVIMMSKVVKNLNDNGKVLGAVTSPCHEGWTWKKAGQDINRLIFGFDGRKFPVLENGGKLHLQFGNNIEYLMALYHQVGPYESNFNETHALRQMNRLSLLMKADVVAGAHRHVGAAEMVYEGTGEERKPVAYIRTGSYKGIDDIHDKFVSDRYGATGEPSAQSVILWPGKKRMETFLDFETGMLAHDAHYIREMMKQKTN
jgi:hypothetical protein